MTKVLFMKAVTVGGNRHELPLAKAEAFGRHNVDSGHAVSFKAGKFKGKGKVVATGADGCTVADDEGREHSIHWHEVEKNHDAEQDQKGKDDKK